MSPSAFLEGTYSGGGFRGTTATPILELCNGSERPKHSRLPGQ